MATNSQSSVDYLSSSALNPPGASPGFVERLQIINFTGNTYSFTTNGMTGVVGASLLPINNTNSTTFYTTQSANSDGTVTPVNSGGTSSSLTFVINSTNAMDCFLRVVSRT